MISEAASSGDAEITVIVRIVQAKFFTLVEKEVPELEISSLV